MSGSLRKPSRNRPPSRQPAPTDQGKPEPRDGTVVVERSVSWQGPLPPPAVLEEFRAVVPDAPERIFRQWEQESEHRRAYERRALEAAIRREGRGQASAILFALSALSVSAFALWMGEPWVAGTIGGGTIVSVVGAFLYQRAVAKPSQAGSRTPPRP